MAIHKQRLAFSSVVHGVQEKQIRRVIDDN